MRRQRPPRGPPASRGHRGEERLEMRGRPGGERRERLGARLERKRACELAQRDLAAREEVERPHEVRVRVRERALERHLVAHDAMKGQGTPVLVHPAEHYRASRTHEVERRSPRRGRADRVDDEIRASLSRQPGRIGVDVPRTGRERHSPARRMRLDHAHVGDTRSARGVEREESDRPGAEHDRCLRGAEPAREGDGMDRVREWLDERTRARVNALGQIHQVRGGHGHALREAARDVDADESALRAKVARAGRTVHAGATGKQRIHHHPMSGPPLATQPTSGVHDRPGELVPHDERRNAVRHPSEVALDLGAADARSLRPHYDLIVAVPRLVDDLDRHLPRTTPDQRAHGRRLLRRGRSPTRQADESSEGCSSTEAGDALWRGNILAPTSAVGRFLMIRREITTSTDRLFSRRRFIYYGAAFAAAVACGPAAAPAPASPAASPSGPVQLKGSKVNLLHWTSFVPDEDKWFKETLVADWAKPNGVDLTVELVSANEAQ